MTFADGVLRLVRIGARIDPVAGEDLGLPGETAELSIADVVAVDAVPDASAAVRVAGEDFAQDDAEAYGPADAADSIERAPGIDDLEASVALVASGLATRVVLAGFPSWPGLLWRAYQLAESADVLILPTVVRPGGKVDIVITRATTANG